MFYDNKRKTVSRAARLIIPPGKTSVKTDYPDQKRNMHHEDLVISSWLTSRDLRLTREGKLVTAKRIRTRYLGDEDEFDV